MEIHQLEYFVAIVETGGFSSGPVWCFTTLNNPPNTFPPPLQPMVLSIRI